MENKPKLTNRHWTEIYKFVDKFNTPAELRQAMRKTLELFRAAHEHKRLIPYLYHLEAYKLLLKKHDEMTDQAL